MLEAVVSTQSTGGHSENWDLHSMLQIFITFIFSVSVGSTFLSTQSTDTNHRFSIVSPEVPFCTLSWTPMGECVAFNFSCVKYGGWIGLGFSNEQGCYLSFLRAFQSKILRSDLYSTTVRRFHLNSNLVSFNQSTYI
eukprot:TRINITY_DN6931_c0_g1_i9.p2 TRINITY_DN6931_c0_g1~~TRINITY_DN6931_c0_g1_i9.p2  ORF type:complete len:137 (-),score=24.38 TRINITY_DN6931_c0_g1_i9:1214-1624(-)